MVALLSSKQPEEDRNLWWVLFELGNSLWRQYSFIPLSYRIFRRLRVQKECQIGYTLSSILKFPAYLIEGVSHV